MSRRNQRTHNKALCSLEWLFVLIVEVAAIGAATSGAAAAAAATALAALVAAAVLSAATVVLALVLLESAALGLLPVAGSHLCILFHHIDHFVRNTKVFDCAAADVAFGHAPKLVTILEGNQAD